ncbi:MAG: hypothetical protein H6Q42_240 [Deltaproteobacteria bacterium]|nr:hypothetical protein [Deltaproteobacteria bacterium]
MNLPIYFTPGIFYDGATFEGVSKFISKGGVL